MVGTAQYKQGESKNKLLKDLIDSGATYLFLYNDCLKIKDPLVFQHYKIVSDKTGFECMTVCGSEPSNEKQLYVNDPYVDYWPYPGGDFLFVTKNALDKVGFIDENFPEDTWEIYELIHRICNAGLTATFGMFVALKDEAKYFEPDMDKIRVKVKRDLERKKELEVAMDYWQSKDPARFPQMAPPKQPGAKIEMRKGVGEI
jgi:hypothetical protein